MTKPTFEYRDNGSPCIKIGDRESDRVSYQGIASIVDKVNHNHYIAVGSYYDGTGLEPEKIYQLIEVS